MAVLPQRLPLAEELELQKLVGLYRHWIRVAFACPLRPGAPALASFSAMNVAKPSSQECFSGTKRLECEAIST